MGWAGLGLGLLGAATAGIGAIASSSAQRNQQNMAQQAQQQNMQQAQAAAMQAQQQQQDTLMQAQMEKQQATVKAAQVGQALGPAGKTKLGQLETIHTSSPLGDPSAPNIGRRKLLGN